MPSTSWQEIIESLGRRVESKIASKTSFLDILPHEITVSEKESIIAQEGPDLSGVLLPKEEEAVLKVCILGDANVGKTTLRHRFLGKGFKPLYMPTIGADFAIKELEISQTKVKLQIWDLAGQQKFARLRRGYLAGAIGALILYDISSPPSFSSITNWINDLWVYNGLGPIPFILIGNKEDIRDRMGVDGVSNVLGMEFCRRVSEYSHIEHGFSPHFLPTSAKENLNVDRAFHSLVISIFSWFNSLQRQSHLSK